MRYFSPLSCLMVASVFTYSLNFCLAASFSVGCVSHALKCFTSSWFVTRPSGCANMYWRTASRENSVGPAIMEAHC